MQAKVEPLELLKGGRTGASSACLVASRLVGAGLLSTVTGSFTYVQRLLGVKGGTCRMPGNCIVLYHPQWCIVAACKKKQRVALSPRSVWCHQEAGMP